MRSGHYVKVKVVHAVINDVHQYVEYIMIKFTIVTGTLTNSIGYGIT